MSVKDEHRFGGGRVNDRRKRWNFRQNCARLTWSTTKSSNPIAKDCMGKNNFDVWISHELRVKNKVNRLNIYDTLLKPNSLSLSLCVYVCVSTKLTKTSILIVKTHLMNIMSISTPFNPFAQSLIEKEQYHSAGVGWMTDNSDGILDKIKQDWHVIVNT